MSSSPSNALSGIPRELKDLFSWNPPLLVPRPFPGRKMSTETREPAFFDKHFTKELKLLHVKRLPSLAHDIATIVDKTIMDSFNDGVQFPPSDTLLSARQLNSIVRNIGRDKTDEKAVASFYDKTTALFCAPIASTLALRLSDWDTLLMWTQSANVYGYAIAGGFLQVAGPTDLADKEAQLKEVMDEETLRLFRSLSTRLASLVTNEFKNMAAGGPEVMLAIPNLSNSPSFDWASCDAPECASATNHERGRKNVAEVSVGPDAKNTPWAFDSRSNNSTSLSNPETVRPQGDDAVDDPSYKDSHDLSAQFIVQQAWAQATRVDGSIIVLQSGNHEFIGIRHRTTQTLYISDLIEPHACKDPSYGKLHVGIYIAGIKDALDRERQKHDARPPDGGNGPSGSGGGKQGGSSGGGPGSGDRGNRGGAPWRS